VYDSIKAAKPWVKFGISPFGIWRPGNPPQIQGTDAYAKLYADSRKWLQNGWVDYLAPQLYWEIEKPATSFPVLLNWWVEQNPKGRQVLAGMDATKTTRGTWNPSEIVNQIRITRRETGVSGHILWNMGTLMHNEALDSTLQSHVYTEPALVPASAWLGTSSPESPNLRTTSTDRKLQITWDCHDEKVRVYLVQARRTKTWRTTVLPARTSTFTFERPFPDVIALTAVDRCGLSSRLSVLETTSH